MLDLRFVWSAVLLPLLVNCAGAAIPTSASPPAYQITDLGAGAGIAINSRGQVTGYNNTQHAFLWTPTVPNGTDGAILDLGTLSVGLSQGYGINDYGQVTGYSEGGAFLWSPTSPNGTNGSMVPLGIPDDRIVSGQGINSNGQIIGIAWIAGTTYTGAHLWTPTTPNGINGTIDFLGTVGGTHSQGYAINAGGQIVGESETSDGFLRAFLWTPTKSNGNAGTMIDLGTFGGKYYSGARSINDAGQVTGSANISDDVASHAFLYDRALHDLGTLGGNSSEGYGINTAGNVVGYSQLPGNKADHAFLWSSGTGMVDLNSLIDPESGWDLRLARSINDIGQITGWGTIGGQEHAYLLTPTTVPEPNSGATITFGAAIVGANLLRRRRTQP
ncbi:MAG: DUF3466 family protein [Pirellulales bacterium]